VLRDWTTRWKREQRKLERVVRPGTDLGNKSAVPKDTPPDKRVLKLHSQLRKAESSVLVQACTGRIGLAKFLYSQKVPGVVSAQCRCGAGEETPRHMALVCIEEAGRRQALRTSERVNYQQLTRTAKGARKFIEWIDGVASFCLVSEEAKRKIDAWLAAWLRLVWLMKRQRGRLMLGWLW
jgi:hypothetical protein